MERSERAEMPAHRNRPYRFKALREQDAHACADQGKGQPPTENDCKRRAALHLANASKTDGRKNQSPYQKHIKRRGQTIQKRRIRGVQEISRIGGDWILKCERVWIGAAQQREDGQRNAQESWQAR